MRTPPSRSRAFAAARQKPSSVASDQLQWRIRQPFSASRPKAALAVPHERGICFEKHRQGFMPSAAGRRNQIPAKCPAHRGMGVLETHVGIAHGHVDHQGVGFTGYFFGEACIALFAKRLSNSRNALRKSWFVHGDHIKRRSAAKYAPLRHSVACRANCWIASNSDSASTSSRISMSVGRPCSIRPSGRKRHTERGQGRDWLCIRPASAASSSGGGPSRHSKRNRSSRGAGGCMSSKVAPSTSSIRSSASSGSVSGIGCSGWPSTRRRSSTKPMKRCRDGCEEDMSGQVTKWVFREPMAAARGPRMAP